MYNRIPDSGSQIVKTKTTQLFDWNTVRILVPHFHKGKHIKTLTVDEFLDVISLFIDWPDVKNAKTKSTFFRDHVTLDQWVDKAGAHGRCWLMSRYVRIQSISDNHGNSFVCIVIRGCRCMMNSISWSSAWPAASQSTISTVAKRSTKVNTYSIVAKRS